ncbi:MAG: hypothetical protein C0514_00405 [Candidatus Puniceispirillum sp.]|nr:hypothetical protein [Candidatus Puniceispirillum sp.]
MMLLVTCLARDDLESMYYEWISLLLRLPHIVKKVGIYYIYCMMYVRFLCLDLYSCSLSFLTSVYGSDDSLWFDGIPTRQDFASTTPRRDILTPERSTTPMGCFAQDLGLHPVTSARDAAQADCAQDVEYEDLRNVCHFMARHGGIDGFTFTTKNQVLIKTKKWIDTERKLDQFVVQANASQAGDLLVLEGQDRTERLNCFIYLCVTNALMGNSHDEQEHVMRKIYDAFDVDAAWCDNWYHLWKGRSNGHKPTDHFMGSLHEANKRLGLNTGRTRERVMTHAWQSYQKTYFHEDWQTIVADVVSQTDFPQEVVMTTLNELSNSIFPALTVRLEQESRIHALPLPTPSGDASSFLPIIAELSPGYTAPSPGTPSLVPVRATTVFLGGNARQKRLRESVHPSRSAAPSITVDRWMAASHVSAARKRGSLTMPSALGSLTKTPTREVGMLLKAVGQLYGEEVASSAAASLQKFDEDSTTSTRASVARGSQMGDGTWVSLSRAEYAQTPFKCVRRD